jgi:inner membrane protein
MDPVTHGLVGAAAAATVSEKEKMRPAAFAGAVSAMLADLDIFIHSPSDPLLNIEVHRQFTHSLVFIPVGALVASAILWWLLRKHLSFKELYLYSLAGYATAGLLDAFTSYGTQLLWPFLDTRFAWNVISVVDPVVTVGLIALIGVAVWKQKHLFVWASWAWLIFFLLFGWLQHNRAESTAMALAEVRGHTANELVIKPTIGNQLLWRANYKYGGMIYTDAIRTGTFWGIRVYEGEAEPEVIPERDFAEFESTTLFNDLKRFEQLSEGFLIRHPEKPEIIGDARYSMLPTSMIPLWGVETDTTDTGRHLPFLYFRDASEEIRSEFLDMLLGN